MRVLVIGGTRNLGHELVLHLLEAGHAVTILNRGQTPDALPVGVERLRADRSSRDQMHAAIGSREWDAVVDLALYTGPEARDAVELFAGRAGHYVFISTGQVYLVLEAAPRPSREEDYGGKVMAEPPKGTRDHVNWVYGVDKRAAEDVFAAAYRSGGFPFTSLRLPMVNGPRDHYGRLYGYVLRVLDGGPILVPAEPTPGLRHVYSADVVRIVTTLLGRGAGKGEAFNLSHDETVPFEDFLSLVVGLIPGAVRPRVARVPSARLDEHGLMPACSPFTNPWMSEPDNTRSRVHLGAVYTPFNDAVTTLVRHYLATRPAPPASFDQRSREIELARSLAGC